MNTILRTAAALLAAASFLTAQDAAAPLRLQGLDQFSSGTARSRGMGGSAIASSTDASALFSNPSLLSSVRSVDLRLGSTVSFAQFQQRQEWHPDEYYAELSLVLDGSIRTVIDTLPQKLTKAYDDIVPDWDFSRTHTAIPTVAASLPFELFGIRATAALGMTEAVALNEYYQNNNVLDPNIGAYRPSPVVRPKVGDSVKVQWYQFRRERTGGITGYSAALAADISKEIAAGITATVYRGSSDDVQHRTERGTFVLKTNNSSGFNVMRNDSVSKQVNINGTSDYSGIGASFAMNYHSDYVTASAVVAAPVEITRDWKETVASDSMGTSASFARKGSDKLSIPLQYAFGLAVRTSKKVTIGIDYIVRSYADAKYTAADTSFHPWLNSSFFRAGVEYRPYSWLSLRTGYREDVQTYAPAGAALLTDPVRGAVYTLGLGTVLMDVRLDVAYEYGTVKTIDAWESNVNENSRYTNAVTFDLGYQF